MNSVSVVGMGKDPVSYAKVHRARGEAVPQGARTGKLCKTTENFLVKHSVGAETLAASDEYSKATERYWIRPKMPIPSLMRTRMLGNLNLLSSIHSAEPLEPGTRPLRRKFRKSI